MQTYIVPVSVYPGSANVLYIRAGNLGPPPSYYYQLQNVTIVPPVPEQVDPTTGDITVPGVPEQTIITVLKDGNIDMTETQWNTWAVGTDDEEYQLNCAAANLNLTRK